jgi:beta-ketodecanoyl-[acyl-carrier-protein] synthase
MNRVFIGGIGVSIPQASISNEELVESFNAWVERENLARAASGLEPLQKSSADFIHHASGIRRRHVHTPDGILDVDRMAPRIPPRDDDALSVLAEFGATAARAALDDAGIEAASVDLVICASSHLQRMYPSIGIEIQQEIGAKGAAFDLSLGCSSGPHRRALVVTPELITAHLNFRDRQTHFIFGDAATALLIEAADEGETKAGRFEVLDTRSWTQFSNNIRSNFGYLTRAAEADAGVIATEGLLIKQQGNKVFKDVTVASHRFIVDFLAEHGRTPETVRRFWLHQANARMNQMILKLAFGREIGHDVAPMVLEELGNTAAAGAVVALAQNHRDMRAGDYGLLCTYGAGYSIGGALLRMM